MPLEDHLGDIIAKARRQKGVGVELAARAAKVSPSELLRVENTGSIKEPIDFSDLAALLDLDPIKLGRIAAGWEPPRVDLSRWRELRMVTTISGGLAVNSYVVWDPTSRKACVFDVGFDAHPIARIVSEHELELLWVFITHGHHDHVEALPELLKAFPNAICFPFSGSTPCFPKRDTLELSTLCIRPVPMPGHTDDGITYLVTGWPDDSPAVAFVGDCLFAGSMGKTSSDSSVAREAIRRHILSLPPPTLICPGHGPLTTVGDEKSNNPFF
ncbi:MAG: MBL fold metallo-hydrolase [Verrucomicrobiae bacterium]|nr:MBL fold metallo-hydrolase [Verrucomicrobiae bacterium]